MVDLPYLSDMKVTFTALEFLLKQGKAVSINKLGSFQPIRKGGHIFIEFNYDPKVDTSPELIKVLAKGGIGVETAKKLIEKEISEILRQIEKEPVLISSIGSLRKTGKTIEFVQEAPLIAIEHSFLPEAKELPVVKSRQSGFPWFKTFLFLILLALAVFLIWQFRNYNTSWKVLLGLEKPRVDSPSLDPHFVDSMINVLLQQMEDSLEAVMDSLVADSIADSLSLKPDSLHRDSIRQPDSIASKPLNEDTAKAIKQESKQQPFTEPEFVYYIIVGSYPDSPSAQKHVNKLHKQGYTSATILRSRGRWRVAVDTAHNKQSLSTKLERYKKEVRKDAWSLKSRNVFVNQ